MELPHNPLTSHVNLLFPIYCHLSKFCIFCFSNMAGPVTLEHKGKLAIITIDNEAKLNALSQDGYYQLASHMREVAERDDVFITILTGKGRFFSA